MVSRIEAAYTARYTTSNTHSIPSLQKICKVISLLALGIFSDTKSDRPRPFFPAASALQLKFGGDLTISGTVASAIPAAGLHLPAPPAVEAALIERPVSVSTHQVDTTHFAVNINAGGALHITPTGLISGEQVALKAEVISHEGRVFASETAALQASSIHLEENSQTLVIRPQISGEQEESKARVVMIAEKAFSGTGFTAGVVGDGFSLVETRRGDVRFLASKHHSYGCSESDWLGRCTNSYEIIMARPPQFLGPVWIRSPLGKVQAEALVVLAKRDTTTRIDAAAGITLSTVKASVHAWQRGLLSRGSSYQEIAASPTISNNLMLCNQEGPLSLEGLVVGGRHLRIDAPHSDVEFSVPRLVSINRFKGLGFGFDVSVLANIFQIAVSEQAKISTSVRLPLIENVENSLLPGNPAAMKALNAYAAMKEASSLVALLQNPAALSLIQLSGRITYLQTASFFESAGPRTYELDKMEIVAKNILSSGVFFRTRWTSLRVHRLIFEGLCLSSSFTHKQVTGSLGVSFSIAGPSLIGGVSLASGSGDARTCLPGGIVSDVLETSAETIDLHHAAFIARAGEIPSNVRVSLQSWQDLHRADSYSASLGSHGGSFSYAESREARSSFVSSLQVGSRCHEDRHVLADEKIQRRGAANLQLFYDLYDRLKPKTDKRTKKQEVKIEQETILIREPLEVVSSAQSKKTVSSTDPLTPSKSKKRFERPTILPLKEIKNANDLARAEKVIPQLTRENPFSRPDGQTMIARNKACYAGMKEGAQNLWHVITHPIDTVQDVALTVHDLWQMAHPKMPFPVSKVAQEREFLSLQESSQRMQMRAAAIKGTLRDLFHGDELTKERTACAMATEGLPSAGLSWLLRSIKIARIDRMASGVAESSPHPSAVRPAYANENTQHHQLMRERRGTWISEENLAHQLGLEEPNVLSRFALHHATSQEAIPSILADGFLDWSAANNGYYCSVGVPAPYFARNYPSAVLILDERIAKAVRPVFIERIPGPEPTWEIGFKEPLPAKEMLKGIAVSDEEHFLGVMKGEKLDVPIFPLADLMHISRLRAEKVGVMIPRDYFSRPLYPRDLDMPPSFPIKGSMRAKGSTLEVSVERSSLRLLLEHINTLRLRSERLGFSSLEIRSY